MKRLQILLRFMTDPYALNIESQIRIKRLVEKLSPEIEQKLELIQSGGIKGKKYSPSEYLHYIDQILGD